MRQARLVLVLAVLGSIACFGQSIAQQTFSASLPESPGAQSKSKDAWAKLSPSDQERDDALDQFIATYPHSPEALAAFGKRLEPLKACRDLQTIDVRRFHRFVSLYHNRFAGDDVLQKLFDLIDTSGSQHPKHKATAFLDFHYRYRGSDLGMAALLKAERASFSHLQREESTIDDCVSFLLTYNTSSLVVDVVDIATQKYSARIRREVKRLRDTFGSEQAILIKRSEAMVDHFASRVSELTRCIRAGKPDLATRLVAKMELECIEAAISAEPIRQFLKEYDRAAFISLNNHLATTQLLLDLRELVANIGEQAIQISREAQRRQEEHAKAILAGIDGLRIQNINLRNELLGEFDKVHSKLNAIQRDIVVINNNLATVIANQNELAKKLMYNTELVKQLLAGQQIKQAEEYRHLTHQALNDPALDPAGANRTAVLGYLPKLVDDPKLWIHPEGLLPKGVSQSSFSALACHDVDVDGKADLLLVCGGPTRSGKTEVHIYGSRTSFAGPIGCYSTALEYAGHEWTFQVCDIDYDRHVDLACLLLAKDKTELHVLSGMSSFKDFSVHETISGVYQRENTRFDLVDVDRKGKLDLVLFELKDSKVVVRAFTGETKFKSELWKEPIVLDAKAVGREWTAFVHYREPAMESWPDLYIAWENPYAHLVDRFRSKGDRLMLDGSGGRDIVPGGHLDSDRAPSCPLVQKFSIRDGPQITAMPQGMVVPLDRAELGLTPDQKKELASWSKDVAVCVGKQAAIGVIRDLSSLGLVGFECGFVATIKAWARSEPPTSNSTGSKASDPSSGKREGGKQMERASPTPTIKHGPISGNGVPYSGPGAGPSADGQGDGNEGNGQKEDKGGSGTRNKDGGDKEGGGKEGANHG